MGRTATPEDVTLGRAGSRWRLTRARVIGGAWVVLAVVGALGVALAWIPFRAHNSSVDVALMLVIVVTAAGASGRRLPVMAAAIAAAITFTVVDTVPFDRFAISGADDIVTAVGMVVVGLVTGELAVRVARQRHTERMTTGDLDRVRQAAALLAAGEELVVMIGSVAAELTRLLRLDECTFEVEPAPEGTPTVTRDGVVAAPGPESDRVLLPVWALGRVVGHYVLRRRGPGGFDPAQLVVAVTLADQVGAALAAQAPPPPERPPGALSGLPPPEAPASAPRPPAPNLRVVR